MFVWTRAVACFFSNRIAVFRIQSDCRLRVSPDECDVRVLPAIRPKRHRSNTEPYWLSPNRHMRLCSFRADFTVIIMTTVAWGPHSIKLYPRHPRTALLLYRCTLKRRWWDTRTKINAQYFRSHRKAYVFKRLSDVFHQT